jgi:nitrogen regulatory protein PII
MKKVEAIIRVWKLDQVKEALKAIGVEGLTVMKATGFGDIAISCGRGIFRRRQLGV